METCLDGAREDQYPGLTHAAACEIHRAAANRLSANAKYTRQLKPPVIPRLEYNKTKRILARALEAPETPELLQPVVNAQQTTPAANDRSQLAGWCSTVQPVAAAPRAETAVPEISPIAQPAARPEISKTPQPVINNKQTTPAANDRSQLAGWCCTFPPAVAPPKTKVALWISTTPQTMANNKKTTPEGSDRSQSPGAGLCLAPEPV